MGNGLDSIRNLPLGNGRRNIERDETRGHIRETGLLVIRPNERPHATTSSFKSHSASDLGTLCMSNSHASCDGEAHLLVCV